MTDCTLGAVSPIENQWLPLAVTRFIGRGRAAGHAHPRPRRGRRRAGAVRARGARRQARHRRLRRTQERDGTERTYPDPSGYVDYDGYIAIYDGDGKPILHHDFNMGRGDVLAALRWLPDDIVAVGSSGWDRWQGGNSISRGADPLIVWLSPDGARAAARTMPLSDGARHFNLFDVTVTDRVDRRPRLLRRPDDPLRRRRQHGGADVRPVARAARSALNRRPRARA